MPHARLAEPARPAPSPLVPSDRLITLARDADRAGLRAAAVCLIGLAHEVLDRPATGSAWRRSGKGRVHAPKPGGTVGGLGIARSIAVATAP